jgi:hypothetical protein
MLPEAIAIVVAPRDNKLPFGIFRLTDEPPDLGLELVKHCEVSFWDSNLFVGEDI